MSIYVKWGRNICMWWLRSKVQLKLGEELNHGHPTAGRQWGYSACCQLPPTRPIGLVTMQTEAEGRVSSLRPHSPHAITAPGTGQVGTSPHPPHPTQGQAKRGIALLRVGQSPSSEPQNSGPRAPVPTWPTTHQSQGASPHAPRQDCSKYVWVCIEKVKTLWF